MSEIFETAKNLTKAEYEKALDFTNDTDHIYFLMRVWAEKQSLELRLSSLTQELEEAKVESKMYEDASVAFYNDTLALEKEIEQLKQSPDAVVAMPEEITAEASIALNHAIGNARRASNTTLQEDMSNIYQAIRKALTNNADKEN